MTEPSAFVESPPILTPPDTTAHQALESRTQTPDGAESQHHQHAPSLNNALASRSNSLTAHTNASKDSSATPNLLPTTTTPAATKATRYRLPPSFQATDENGRQVLIFDSKEGQITVALSPIDSSEDLEAAQPKKPKTIDARWGESMEEQDETRPKRLRPAPNSSMWSGLVHTHGPEFAFYSQFVVVACYYVLEYLEVLNIANRPTGFIAGVPGFVLLLTIINTCSFRVMRRLQILTIIVEFLCFIGLLIYDAITPRNQDDRHRTEYYDMHAHAAALNFILVCMYGAVWTAGYRRWIVEERATEAVLAYGTHMRSQKGAQKKNQQQTKKTPAETNPDIAGETHI